MDQRRRLSQAARVVRPWRVSILVAACAATARAESEEEAVRLQYTAPAECPDAASFAARVRERTARGRFAEPNELARTFDVELVPLAQGFSGSLEFLDDNGAQVSRHVHGEQCDEVVSSLALITALALDATLPSEHSEPAAIPAVPPLPQPPVKAPPTQRPAPPSERTTGALRGVRVGVQVGYGNATSAPRLGVLAQLDFRSGLTLRWTAHYAWHELAVDPGRSANLQLLGLETSLCPWRFRWGTFGLSPCAAVDLGALRAAGVPSQQLTSASDETIGWASLGTQLGLSWEPDALFWVELRAAAEFPLRAGYRFTFENPDQTAYQVPYVAGWGAIGSGVRFW